MNVPKSPPIPCIPTQLQNLPGHSTALDPNNASFLHQCSTSCHQCPLQNSQVETPILSTIPASTFSSSRFKKSTTKNNSRCITGTARDVRCTLNFHLPKTPPVRGNVRVKKNAKRKLVSKEKIFQSREHVLKRYNLKGKATKKAKYQDNDLQIIQNPNEMLTDTHINAAQQLLAVQYPNMHGLQDTVLGTKLKFSIETDFIQVLHDGSLHWITASNIFCEDKSVQLFDSLYSFASLNVKMQIASIMMIQEPKLKIQFVNFQRQKGGID